MRMRLFRLLIYFTLVGCTLQWTLNDLYKDYVTSLKKDGKPSDSSLNAAKKSVPSPVLTHLSLAAKKSVSSPSNHVQSKLSIQQRPLVGSRKSVATNKVNQGVNIAAMKKSPSPIAPKEVHSFNVVANFHRGVHPSKLAEVKPTSAIMLSQNQKKNAEKAKKRAGEILKAKPLMKGELGAKSVLEINPKPMASKLSNNSFESVKQQTHLTEPLSPQQVLMNKMSSPNIQNSMYPMVPQQTFYQKNYFNGYPQQQYAYPMRNPSPMYPPIESTNAAFQRTPKTKAEPCIPSARNLCPTAPVDLFMRATPKPSTAVESHNLTKPLVEQHTVESDKKGAVEINKTQTAPKVEATNQQPGPVGTAPSARRDVPEGLREFVEKTDKGTFNVAGVQCSSTPEMWGNRIECDQKLSFEPLLKQLFTNGIDLNTPSRELIVPGKFDCHAFDVNRDQGFITFHVASRELLDVIPNHIRVSKANASVGFNYFSTPNSLNDFDISMNGMLKLDKAARKMKVESKKPKNTCLFSITMETKDLEIPEFTKLFTDADLSQQRSELPPDLSTLVLSSLRSPRIEGHYDCNGAFEFVASSKSPASIFPSQPTVYIIVQKPRLGKVVTGAICKFEDASYRSFISSILNQDFSNIPLFNDVQTDMAIGLSRDGLYTVRDDNFKREMSPLLSNGNTIKKGLTVKSKLPIRKIVADSNSNAFSNSSQQSYPETVLVNTEVYSNRMHIEFPDDLRIGLSGIPQLFGERNEDMNFPRNILNMDDTDFKITGYDIDDIDKKALTIYFEAPSAMKIGSLMSLDNAKAKLRRNEISKWDFNATGDYKLGNTTVGILLKSQDSGFLIDSDKSSIQSGLLVDLLDKRSNVLKKEMSKHHMDDFVIDDFRVTGTLTNKNTIRFKGKPEVFSVDDGRIEFVASEEPNRDDSLAMGVYFKQVDLDNVFGRMLDKKMSRRSWTTGVDAGLVIGSNKNAANLGFESDDLKELKVEEGSHLQVELKRPEFSQCKGDSLCRMLSNEMPKSSRGFIMKGGMDGGRLHLSTPIVEPLVVNKALQLSEASLRMNVDRHIDVSVPTTMTLPGVNVPFNGDLHVDNAGLLQLSMKSDNTWDKPFGLRNTRFQNLSFLSSYEPGTPLPSFDVNARMYIGRDPTDETKSIEAPAVLKINALDPTKNSFSAKLHDTSFDKIASAFGTKKPLLRFQHEAYFLEDANLEFEPHKEAEDDSTADAPKGQIKATGRMRILGQMADYNIKFLNKNGEILSEIWLPDIGVNQGLMTIHAGLKSEQRSNIDSAVHNGPALLCRMDPRDNSAVLVGKLSTLRFSRLSALKLDDDGLSGKIYATLPGGINANVSLKADYEDNIQDSNFQTRACLPITDNVKANLFKLLHQTASQTKRTLISAEDRVSMTEKIYETTKSMIEKHKKSSLGFIEELRGKADDMTKLRKGIRRHCVHDCGQSCMGLPSWKKNGIEVAGHNVVGSPTWESCSRKIPDLNCITRCLGRKVIENVKANNKQMELQTLMESLANTKRSLQEARSLVERGRTLVDSTLNGLEKVNKEIKVGVDISKFLNKKDSDNAIKIDGACFQDSLENAERSLVKFMVESDVDGKRRTFDVEAALDGNLETNLADAIANQVYPGYYDFNKKLEQVKLLLSNLDGQKNAISRDIDEVTNGRTDSNQLRSQINWSAEEDEFRKLAFGELPRFTLSDDETLHAFEEKSIWEIAPNNNPLYETENKKLEIKGTKKTNINPDSDNSTLCGQLRSSVDRYQQIVNPLAEFTESFLQEKIMFYRQKNRRLADLRMIDDQIKSDCFVENCTMEDMDNALSYLGRARDGTLKWSKVIEGQIEDQNKVALGYFANRTRSVIEAENGMSLRRFIIRTRQTAENAIKKTNIPKKQDLGDRLQDVSKDLYSLLIGVKTSEELSKMASKIFNMKHQIQDLKKANVPCVESIIREKLESKSGLLHFKSKKNSTTNYLPLHHNATKSLTKDSKKHKTSILNEDDDSKYARGGQKKHANVHPSAKPLVTRVQNIQLHHEDNKFMKAIDVRGETKSNIESGDTFVVNQPPVPVPQNTFYGQNANLQKYGYNPYGNMYWKKKK
eukprot:TCONS_00023302-protein